MHQVKRYLRIKLKNNCPTLSAPKSYKERYLGKSSVLC